ncbi:MAG: hypothetical protein ACYSWW_13110 [Planctomycetota bacterium]
MKTSNHRTSVKTMCILLIMLSSASVVEAYPPDNAAILYYRAFLVMKEPSEEVKEMKSDLRGGKIESNNQIKQYIEENRRAIELLETAAEIPNCDWGRDESKGFGLLLPELGKIRQMVFPFVADAQTLSQNGQHKAALNKCMTIHKMARHVGDDLLISYLVGIALNNLANGRVEDFLSAMPADLETLMWLRSQIMGASANVTSMKRALNREKEIALREIRKEKIESLLKSMGDAILKDKPTADAVERARKGDDKFFKDNRDYYANVTTDTIAALDLPYPEAHKRLKELNDRIQKDAKENPAAIMTDMLMPATARICTLGTKRMTFFNALKAAIDIYIIKAKTGRLPDSLPAGSPKDLFSGKDFEYEKTKDGFVLRSRRKDPDKHKTVQCEFKVPK